MTCPSVGRSQTSHTESTAPSPLPGPQNKPPLAKWGPRWSPHTSWNQASTDLRNHNGRQKSAQAGMALHSLHHLCCFITWQMSEGRAVAWRRDKTRGPGLLYNSPLLWQVIPFMRARTLSLSWELTQSCEEKKERHKSLLMIYSPLNPSPHTLHPLCYP